MDKDLLTNKSPHWHEAAHPTDLAFGEIKAILDRKSVWLLKTFFCLHLVWRKLEEGGGGAERIRAEY